ncbi:MAG: hypothetical protein ABEH64_05320 [Salinirussus sp.]
MSGAPAPGRSWVYEDIVSAIPGLELPPRYAIAIQFLGFEAIVLSLAAVYQRPSAAVVGTVAVIVASTGSAAMVTIAREIRIANPSPRYSRLLFGSNVEVVLGVLAYAALSTYLVITGGDGGLFESVLGPEPPAPAVFVAFVLAWDVSYRIGVGWWASLIGCWRSFSERVTAEAAASYRRADLVTLGFASVQLLLVPVIASERLLALAVVGHVAAVFTVSGLSLLALERRKVSPPESA